MRKLSFLERLVACWSGTVKGVELHKRPLRLVSLVSINNQLWLLCLSPYSSSHQSIQEKAFECWAATPTARQIEVGWGGSGVANPSTTAHTTNFRRELLGKLKKCAFRFDRGKLCLTIKKGDFRNFQKRTV
jgi:hypothetical protein